MFSSASGGGVSGSREVPDWTAWSKQVPSRSQGPSVGSDRRTSCRAKVSRAAHCSSAWARRWASTASRVAPAAIVLNPPSFSGSFPASEISLRETWSQAIGTLRAGDHEGLTAGGNWCASSSFAWNWARVTSAKRAVAPPGTLGSILVSRLQWKALPSAKVVRRWTSWSCLSASLAAGGKV